jgi:hypothetical protein
MHLVHPVKGQEGRWEVAWMWLPHFLAADQALHKYVDQKMTEAFRGDAVVDSTLFDRMHERVLSLILEKYPIPGMRDFLRGYVHLRPGEEGEEHREDEGR